MTGLESRIVARGPWVAHPCFTSSPSCFSRIEELENKRFRGQPFPLTMIAETALITLGDSVSFFSQV